VHNTPCPRDIRNLETLGPKTVVTIGKNHQMKLHLTNYSAIKTGRKSNLHNWFLLLYHTIGCIVLYTARGKASIMDARPEVSMRFSYLVLTNQNQSLLGSYTKRQFCTGQ